MFKSWKTFVAGLITVACTVLPLFGVPIPPGVAEVIVGVVVGGGLMVAKDGNVTGGTVDNGKRPDDKGAL